MRKILLLLILLACAATPAHAQGTVQFIANFSGANEVPPNSSPYLGTGNFTLTDDSFSYSIWLSGPSASFAPTSGGIYGPATAVQNGNLLFDLGNWILTFNPPARGYLGEFFLTTQQISDLEAGLWYVNLTSPSFPGGEIRGQINPVPEPLTLALLGVAIGIRELFSRREH